MSDRAAVQARFADVISRANSRPEMGGGNDRIGAKPRPNTDSAWSNRTSNNRMSSARTSSRNNPRSYTR